VGGGKGNESWRRVARRIRTCTGAPASGSNNSDGPSSSKKARGTTGAGASAPAAAVAEVWCAPQRNQPIAGRSARASRKQWNTQVNGVSRPSSRTISNPRARGSQRCAPLPIQGTRPSMPHTAAQRRAGASHFCVASITNGTIPDPAAALKLRLLHHVPGRESPLSPHPWRKGRKRPGNQVAPYLCQKKGLEGLRLPTPPMLEIFVAERSTRKSVSRPQAALQRSLGVQIGPGGG